jgi:pimeloyl-ACP methyl ester carboxylesterase
MLAVVRALPDRFATRQEAAAGIMRAGYSAPVAQWMTTNLARDGEMFVWRLDFDAMERLLRDFFATDLWPVVEEAAPAHDIHILKASASSVISPEAVARIGAAGKASVHLHEREGGHWIHAESPELVTALLAEHLP